MNKEKIITSIREGKTALGIEFGSTRIKAVLVDETHTPIASGSHEWENRLEDGIWTYSLEDIWTGLQDSYRNMAADVKAQYGEELTTIGAIGFSAMMHGYMVFDEKGELLVPFRTWRNSITGEAAAELSELFQFNIPQRWTIAHLYQAILNGEEHVERIHSLCTLACYVHWKLTGRKVAGVGEASGFFPLDSAATDYDKEMMEKFSTLIEGKHFPWKLRELLPDILMAGEDAGTLTEEGAKLLDISGKLRAGIPFCPPEGDADTGMVATHSVSRRTGNVSAGTSVFGMFVLEKGLAKMHPEIDVLNTPAGDLVAMVHCNNCTSDLNGWVGLFDELLSSFGKVDRDELFSILFHKALEGNKDCGGLMSFNYFSGEHVTEFEEGRPLFMRRPDSRFNLANFMRTILYSSLATLKIGLDILLKEEHVQIDSITGHGGLFKTKGVGQSILSAAMNAPISVMETAGEGGAWGMALLSAYMLYKEEGQSLSDYLDNRVFADMVTETIAPDPADVAGFEAFMEQYKACLPVERAAVECMKGELL